jgi:trans-aconitate 2-methyltransferase
MKENQLLKNSEIIEYYNILTSRQLSVGVNERHFSIAKKMSSLGLNKKSKVLEIGCGIGTLTSLLIKKVSSGTIHAIDISDSSVNIAKSKLSKFKNLKLHTGDILCYAFDEKFDFIVLPDVLEHIPLENHKGLFLKMKSMLEKNGKILIHIPNPYYLDFCRNEGMKMQVVDQSLYLPLIVESLKSSGLYISLLEINKIWTKQGDYKFLVLEHEDIFNTFTNKEEKLSFFTKLIQKLKYESSK